MANMNAALWYGPGRDNFRIEQIERPEPEVGEVVLRIRSCYFCAMYVRAVLHGHPKLQPPVVFGRMIAGEVAAVGRGVEGIREGMRVTINPDRPCGMCFYCQKALPEHCLEPLILSPGGMAEYVRVSAGLVPGICELPDSLPYDWAAYSETLACALHGVLLSEITLGDRVVILGAGGVGLTFVQLARIRGAAKILIADPEDIALQAAAPLGAHRVVNITRESLEEAVAEETDGHGADVVIEAVGCGGTAVGFGGTPPGTAFRGDPNLIHYRCLRVHGSYRYRPAHFRSALDLISSGQIDMGPIVTHHLPFDQVATTAVDLYRTPECRTLVIDL